MKDFISLYKSNRDEKKLIEKMRVTKSYTNTKKCMRGTHLLALDGLLAARERELARLAGSELDEREAAREMRR